MRKLKDFFMNIILNIIKIETHALTTEEVPMKKEKYNLEGIEIEVEKYDKSDKDAERRRLAYCFRMIREKSGMSRTDFSAWLGVPYRTMQEWELGRRAMPEYVLRFSRNECGDQFHTNSYWLLEGLRGCPVKSNSIDNYCL